MNPWLALTIGCLIGAGWTHRHCIFQLLNELLAEEQSCRQDFSPRHLTVLSRPYDQDAENGEVA